MAKKKANRKKRATRDARGHFVRKTSAHHDPEPNRKHLKRWAIDGVRKAMVEVNVLEKTAQRLKEKLEKVVAALRSGPQPPDVLRHVADYYEGAAEQVLDTGAAWVLNQLDGETKRILGK